MQRGSLAVHTYYLEENVNFLMMTSTDKLQSLVDKFNQHSKSDLITIKKCSELQEKKHYAVHAMKKMDTSVGEAVIVLLGDSPYKEGDTPKFQVYLPKRFVNVLMNEDLDSVKSGVYYLVSHGPSANNSTELTIHLNNAL